jgi:hypothetical protein
VREAWIEAPWTVKLAIVLVLLNVSVGAIVGTLTSRIDPADLPFEVITRMVAVAILLGFASRLILGRNWARILLTVLVGLVLIASVLDVVGGIHAFTPLALGQNVPDVAGVILLWLPLSWPHFTRR